MTENQAERIKDKITKIKRALAADKRRWGGFYDDSRGLRYLPPALFLKLSDYKGALRYFKWFEKNFPDDTGYPIFLFEWTITLYKNGQFKNAEKKTLETFFSNTYLIDKFLDKEFLYLDIAESSNWELETMIENFKYSKKNTDLQDFAEWIQQFVISDTFCRYANEFVDIGKRLKNEPVGPKRTELVERRYNLLDDFDRE